MDDCNVTDYLEETVLSHSFAILHMLKIFWLLGRKLNSHKAQTYTAYQPAICVQMCVRTYINYIHTTLKYTAPMPRMKPKNPS